MIKQIKQIKQIFFSEDGYEQFSEAVNQNITFRLYLDALEIGTLCFEDNIWSFEYSKQFKNQSDIKTITSFPDVNKIYQAKDLWPSFTIRIPSPAQPAVKRIIEKEQLDIADLGVMLKRFGENCIANPFVLKPA